MDTPFKIIKDLTKAFALFDLSKKLHCDTETIGFYGQIRLVQLYQKGMPEVTIVEWPEPILLAALLNSFDQNWHNAHYDITTIQQQTKSRWIPPAYDDTFLLARLFYFRKEKFDLSSCLTYAVGYCPYERQGLDKKKLQKSNWKSPVLTNEQLRYAACDVYYMPALWEVVQAAVTDQNYVLDMLTLGYCLDFQWNGMPVVQQRIFDHYQENVERLEEINLPVNCNSWKQVRAWLGCTESDKLALKIMKVHDGDERAGLVSECRSLLKQLNFLDKYDVVGGRVYGKFKPSARSGRLTSDDINQQQHPRALKIAFEAPKGRKLYYADYAQVELRTICAITACRAMEKLFREGVDLHGYTAQMIFGDGWGKKQRDLVKTYNFGFLYGGGIIIVINLMLLQAEVILTELAANRDRRRWRNLWTEIYAWQQRGIANWKAGRIGKTPYGRRYKSKMMTDHLSIENQGAAAEVAKLALHYLMPKLKAYSEEEKCEVFLCDFIHDSFIVEGPDEAHHYAPISAIIAESMQDAWFEMSQLYKIKDLPMPVNVLVGSNWGDIENGIFDYEYKLEGMALCKNLN